MLKCTKFNFGWVSTSDPAGGAYCTASDLAGFRDPTSKRKGGRRIGWAGMHDPQILSWLWACLCGTETPERIFDEIWNI